MNPMWVRGEKSIERNIDGVNPKLFMSIGMMILTTDNFGRTLDIPHSTSRGR